MKTDTITIRSDLYGKSDAMYEAERFSEYLHLTGRNALHIRLLTEEAISLVHGIVNEFEGEFWLESERIKGGVLCRICVSANVNVSDGQEEKLLDVSTSGKNEAAKGIIGKLRQVLRWSLQQTDNEEAAGMGWYDLGYHSGPALYSAGSMGYFWSLAEYRNTIRNSEQATAEARDELEKSIIANLADEVRVGIRSGKAEVIIEKAFPTAG